MANILEHGHRPFLNQDAATESGAALGVCPGVALSHSPDIRSLSGVIPELFDGWGPVLAVWEGYASDKAIRLAGSSGGLATALSVYCLEQLGMSGALHTAAHVDTPYLNETVLSTSRAQMLARAGSRYSPASPAAGLAMIEEADFPCVFVGKPCDVAAVQKVRILRSDLDRKLGLVIAFFCAGVPSTKGTLDLLRANGVDDLEGVKDLRFRGNGWPGLWVARFKNRVGENETRQMTYADSWGFLQKYRQWRCYICPDHTGEFADIAVGDPWYRKIDSDEPGKSLIVARTARGMEIIQAAVAAGYVVLENRDPTLLPKSQQNLLATRSALWGRLLALRLGGAPLPKYEGFSLFKLWLRELTIREKMQSLYGTVKRMVSKELRKKIQPKKWLPPSRRSAS
jgi:coenzyme F420 hydrogenase subunit beta